MSEIVIKMPPLGESVTEATIASWMVEPGTKVKKYDPLLEAMSDKVTTEIPASDDGVVKELLVAEGEVVEIGTDIMTLDTINELVQEEVNVINEIVENNESTTETVPRYSPAVLKIAGEKGIDLKLVNGTGTGGRITRKDVLNYQPNENPTINDQVSTTTQTTAAPAKDVTVWESELNKNSGVPVSGLRKVIAKNMLKSVTEIPQAWTMIEVDVTNLVKARHNVKDDFKNKNGYSLSYFPFFVKAVSQALMNHPKLNSSWQNNTIVTNNEINTSIAVATEDALFVPVIKRTNNLSISGIASEINRLVVDVRNNTLKNEDMIGGTFTVNNTGSFGSVESMGIINAPQAAILQVESIRKEVKVMPDNSIAIRDMVNLCLTIDHRLLDGLVAGRFLNEVKANLENIDETTNIY